MSENEYDVAPEGEVTDGESEDSYTKEDAEKAGWAFVHAKEEQVAITSGTQGETRIAPGEYRAEKTVNDKLVNEFAESEELLLKRIAAYEQHLKSVGYYDEPEELPANEVAARDLEDIRVAEEAEAKNVLHAIESGDVPVPDEAEEPEPRDVHEPVAGYDPDPAENGVEEPVLPTDESDVYAADSQAPDEHVPAENDVEEKAVEIEEDSVEPASDEA